MNTQIVPPAPERTRDMFSAEQVAELLRPLVDEFGAGVVNQAAQRIADHDPVERARVEADARRVLAGTQLLAELFPATTAAYAA